MEQYAIKCIITIFANINPLDKVEHCVWQLNFDVVP